MHTNQTLNLECTTTNTMLSSAMHLAPLVLIRVAWCPFVVSSRFASWTSCSSDLFGSERYLCAPRCPPWSNEPISRGDTFRLRLRRAESIRVHPWLKKFISVHLWLSPAARAARFLLPRANPLSYSLCAMVLV